MLIVFSFYILHNFQIIFLMLNPIKVSFPYLIWIKMKLLSKKNNNRDKPSIKEDSTMNIIHQSIVIYRDNNIIKKNPSVLYILE